ncbi:MAG: oxidoreductase C-terminal domain-containing protein, partial [Pseudohongiellaceae bacterium]
AIQQAELVAENMMGATKTYIPIPWFWSDQYDTRLQIAGLSTSYDRIASRASTKDGGWSHWYYIGDHLLAIDAINDPQAFMAGKRLLEMGRSPSPEIIQNPETKLKALLKG